MLIRYSSNNSGGNWWLNDEDWKKLEKAGWEVQWIKDEKHPKKPNPECSMCNGTGYSDKERCLCFENILADHAKEGRWLGALAKEAEKEFDDINDAIKEFEKITKQDVSDEGCNCCGPPHSFSWEDEKGEYQYCSGDSCLEYLFQDKDLSKSKREYLERIYEKNE